MDDTVQLGRRRTEFGLRAYAGWVAASAAGALVGMAFIYLIIFAAKAVVPGVNEDRLVGWILFPVLGAFIGAGQWLLLRDRIAKPGRWIVLTALGLGAGTFLMFRAAGATASIPPAQLSLAAAGVGLCVGLAQLVALRPAMRGAVIWLLLSALGWLCMPLVIGESMDRLSDLVALGAIPAAFTGPALMLFPPRKVID